MNLLIEKFKQNPWLAFGLAFTLLCGGFTWIRANHLNQLTAKESELINQLETIRGNAKHSKNIEQDIQNLETHVASIDERLFSREERAINVDFFYKFEEKFNILISEVEQVDEENRRFAKDGFDELKLYSVIMYNITLDGTFQEMLKFLYEIYQLKAIMRITDFQINITDNYDDESRNVAANLTASLRVAVLAENITD